MYQSDPQISKPDRPEQVQPPIPKKRFLPKDILPMSSDTPDTLNLKIFRLAASAENLSENWV
ncbi:MAG: hypothetical protein LH628_13870 [Microcoleus sp. CAN_BIN18]|nr:hypothetical protein [Microcoleus sp. CAN_BIN18]